MGVERRPVGHGTEASPPAQFKNGNPVFGTKAMRSLADSKRAEFAEAAELFEAQRGLQFIRDFEKGHARIIAAGEKFVLRPLCGVRPRPRGCLRSA